MYAKLDNENKEGSKTMWIFIELMNAYQLNKPIMFQI